MNDHSHIHPLAPCLADQYRSQYPKRICQRAAHLPIRSCKIFLRGGCRWMTTRSLTHLPHVCLTNIQAYIVRVSVRELPTCPSGLVKFLKRRLLMNDHLNTHPLAQCLSNQHWSLYPLKVSVRELPTCPPGLLIFFKEKAVYAWPLEHSPICSIPD